MTRRGTNADRDIWIGDVLEAWHSLAAQGPRERADIAERLGFDARALREHESPSGRQATAAPLTPSRPRDSDAGTGASTGSARRDVRVIPSTVEIETSTAKVDVHAWIEQAAPLRREDDSHQEFRPRHMPLLRPVWARHIISAMAAVHVEEGSLDEPRLIEAVSRLRPVVRLPRMPRRTLRRGLQLLIDRGPAMLPFRSDVQDLITGLRTVVARDQLQAAAFEYTPIQAGEPVLWLHHRRWAPWHPPGPGTPILVVSDFGLSRKYGQVRGAMLAEWLAFAARCRTAGCVVAALVPRDEAAWPPALRTAFRMVPWDQRTTVATVLRLWREPAR